MCRLGGSERPEAEMNTFIPATSLDYLVGHVGTKLASAHPEIGLFSKIPAAVIKLGRDLL